MARNSDVMMIANQWVELTNSNVTALRIQLRGDCTKPIILQATTGPAPVSTAGGVMLMPGQTLAADLTLSQVWPGLAGANRVWGMCEIAQPVSVSHA